MQIRQLTPVDAGAYQKLRLFALQESPTAFGSSYAEEVDRPIEVVEERLGDASNHAFGAFTHDGRLSGVAILRREEKVKRVHKASIFAMYVFPGYRDQGVGRSLLAAVISRARELSLRQVNLSVVRANEAAVHLYESSGFKPYGLEMEAFKVGDDFYDVVYMSLRL